MRGTALVELRVGEASLLAVPAVHFRVEYAQEVNALCSDPERRPQAIAVELGAATAAAARDWLAELGIGPERRTPLPCMLGLTKRSRFLRASARERAMALQRASGKNLGDLAPALLYEELKLASSSVFVLSPVDSIVEAIRCAVELDLPLYGVDLEEMAEPIYSTCPMPDPTTADGEGGGHLRHFAAQSPSDPEIDPRRELAMAARLKGLLARHGRVLFTCGMAHWERLATRLSEAGLRPSLKGLDTAATDTSTGLRRIVVHPSLAVARMDAFPAVAKVYERRRRHPRLDSPVRHRPIRRAVILRALLRSAYRRHFSRPAERIGYAVKRRDWSSRLALEQMLFGQTLLEMRSQPTLHLVDLCARATVSREFCGVLRETFAEFPWVAPGSMPGVGQLRPALVGEGKSGSVVLCDGDEDSEEAQVPAVLPGRSSGADAFPMPDAWRERVALKHRAMGYRFTWRPWEDLMNGLCAMAIARSLDRRRLPVSEPFAGHLLEGLDVKATLRAHSRGEERIWVRDARLQHGEAPPELPEGFPVVWVFGDNAGESGECRWSTYFEPIEWLANFTSVPGAFRRLLREPADGLVDLIVYSRQAPDQLTLDDLGGGVELLSGLVSFAPIFHSYQQTVAWFQMTQAARNPVRRSGGLVEGSVVRDLAGRVGPACRALGWRDQMIAAALPYSGSSVTVVAPPGFAISPVVAQAAARQGKRISLVDSSTFPADLMERIVSYHVLPGRMDENGETEYMPKAAQIIGEPVMRYSHLVPESWRTFGLGR